MSIDGIKGAIQGLILVASSFLMSRDDRTAKDREARMDLPKNEKKRRLHDVFSQR